MIRFSSFFSSSGAARRVTMLAAAAFYICGCSAATSPVDARGAESVSADVLAATVAAKLQAQTGDLSVVKYAGGAGATGVVVAVMALWLSHRREMLRIRRQGIIPCDETTKEV